MNHLSAICLSSVRTYVPVCLIYHLFSYCLCFINLLSTIYSPIFVVYRLCICLLSVHLSIVMCHLSISLECIYCLCPLTRIHPSSIYPPIIYLPTMPPSHASCLSLPAFECLPATHLLSIIIRLIKNDKRQSFHLALASSFSEVSPSLVWVRALSSPFPSLKGFPETFLLRQVD